MNISDIWKYDLRKGNSGHPRNGACLFDAGMWLVYGKIGDNPPCSCPVIRSYAIKLNDAMPHELRQELLKPFILRVVGNRDPKAESERLRILLLETARRIVPMTAPELAEFQLLRHLPDRTTLLEIEAAARSAANATYATYAAYATGAVNIAYKAANAYAANAANAYAANAAAYAANAAAYATNAANAANAANAVNAAANAAAYATNATNVVAVGVRAKTPADVWKQAVVALDKALRIGKQSPEFDEAEVRRSVKDFATAAGLLV